jgi:glycosyltransferase involved in cell wall biosynthesis
VSARRLRIAVDLRCLAWGGYRGWARYADELCTALAKRPSLELFGIVDAPLSVELPIQIVLIERRSEIVWEQILLSWACHHHGVDVLWAPANRGLPLLLSVPSLLTLHDAVEWDPELVPTPRGRSRFRFNYASVASLATATLIIAPSSHSAQEINSRLRISPKRIRVVPEAAAPRFFDNPGAAAIDAVRSTYGIADGAVLYLGGFDSKKDIGTLLRAWSLVENRLSTQLVLAGAMTAEAAVVKAQARTLGLETRVNFAGFIAEADLPALYRAATCFVFPGHSEGFGLPVIEAMASGTPVIAADAGAIPEVAGSGAEFFPAGDAVGLARKLTQVLGSREWREQLGIAGTARARELNWDTAAELTEAIFQEVVRVPIRARLTATAASLRALPHWLR